MNIYFLKFVGDISLVYELVHPVNCRIVREQGYLDKLMDFRSELPETNQQFALMREKMDAYMRSIFPGYVTRSGTVQRSG